MQPCSFSKIDNVSDVRKVLDFYRLALFGKDEIDKNKLNAILTFQTIGTSITFYFMTRYAEFYAMIEVATIEIPTTKRNITTIISYLDELLAITCLHSTVKKNHEDLNQPSPILPFIYLQAERKTLERKRKPSIGAIASSSKRC
ncbi:uncharacterized protein BYT42DRAFT_497480 [Radiomyces spectabilis]|uniref:uncharacterized protein n=1 Tax=Radiomyces spectabilis TaxID=64574 RepID=UPI002220CBC1|nr:uncharacterized protein BYT42DRAFT_497480 [Radiomyces spectabilis]KAI8377762.1 hypothetical protein BYT42DRAFT_497480 [Radiomyces spectabilis]